MVGAFVNVGHLCAAGLPFPALGMPTQLAPLHSVPSNPPLQQPGFSPLYMQEGRRKRSREEVVIFVKLKAKNYISSQVRWREPTRGCLHTLRGWF